MIAVGLILVLVGFAMLGSRGAMPGSTAARNIRLGPQRFSTRGYQGIPSTRFRVIQVLIGLAILAAGVVLIMVSS